jgi:hypothetical protein
VYPPDGAEISKLPALSVIACITEPLVGSKATIDLGITAPVTSVMVPVMLAIWDSDCAKHEAVMISTANHIRSMKDRMSL